MEFTTHHDDNALAISCPLVEKVLVRFLKDGAHNSGFKKSVLGLSGGLDSAVVAFLLARALGPKNVLGAIMPHRVSNPSSAKDARLVAKACGIKTETVDISPLADGYMTGAMSNVRKGNIMARARMIVLYDLSARDKSLVIGTSNKTELLLGYGTQHGDLACALNPIGDLYKTQIRQLAKHLGVPAKVIEKAPSADLWEGQTDEGELGFTYAEADALLQAMVDERFNDAQLEKMGFKKKLIATVRQKVRVNQFKRQPPVIAKLSQRTINLDFRYPRDWGM